MRWTPSWSVPGSRKRIKHLRASPRKLPWAFAEASWETPSHQHSASSLELPVLFGTWGLKSPQPKIIGHSVCDPKSRIPYSSSPPEHPDPGTHVPAPPNRSVGHARVDELWILASERKNSTINGSLHPEKSECVLGVSRNFMQTVKSDPRRPQRHRSKPHP